MSDNARVRSLPRYIVGAHGNLAYRKGKIMSQSENSDGYYTVKLSRDGNSVRIAVHTLVAKAYVDGYFDGAEVDHIDCNRKNNLPENLRWVTHLENIKHSVESGSHISCSDMSGKNNPNYGNRALSKRYAEDRSFAKEKQSRRGSGNGKAKAILAHLPNGLSISFSYIGECAEFLIANGYTRTECVNSVRTGIGNSIRRGSTYNGNSFEYT